MERVQAWVDGSANGTFDFWYKRGRDRVETTYRVRTGDEEVFLHNAMETKSYVLLTLARGKVMAVGPIP
jgi:hypothetical protein